MTITAGTKLGPYEILGPLGAGGMGEVYRARDTRLGRDVAIKVLPASFTADAAAKARFDREAKTISGLNHPNICVLHDVGHQDGADFLVMECVEGETLAKRLEKGPLPQEQVLKVGAQIAEALDRAHRSGIVHRDLKPGNVMLTATGAKLLDFGLAKETAGVASLVTVTASNPVSPVTQQGMIVGTFQYMSPEQIEGKELDGRSDIFSLGAVLYEMVTGKRAFEGKTQLSVASAILEREPEPIRAVKSITPPALEHAIQRCLAKDREERWQAARDLAMELDWIGKSGSQTEAPAIRKKTKVRMWLVWALAGAAALGLLLGAIFWRGAKAPEPMMIFSAPLSFAARDMAMAPNGHTVAVVGDRGVGSKSALWLYEVGSQDATMLPNTDGANFPFWSPDGKSLAFFAEGKLKRLDLNSGAVQTLTDAPSGRGGSWNQDGVIVFTPSGKLGQSLMQIPATGGTAKIISTLDTARGETSHRWPTFLPDGKHFVFMGFTVVAHSNNNAIYLGTLGSTEKKFLVDAMASPGFAAPDWVLFYRDDTLFAQRLDLRKLELTGPAKPILTEVQNAPRIGRAAYSAANGGALMAQTGRSVSLSQLVWFDRSGKQVESVGKAKEDVYANPSLSPDRRMVAVDRTDSGNQNADVWIYNVEGEGTKRLTFDPAIDAVPVWSPDGKQVVFASGRKGGFDLYLKPADGSQEEKVVTNGEGEDKYPNAWSQDGKYILYLYGKEMRYLSYPELQAHPFLQTSATVKNGQFSPDGKWVAYASNESGRWEVYVTSFPEAHGKWQVSSGGGEQPRWRGDGKELFYLSADGKLMAMAVKEGANFDAGAPEVLFQTNAREPLATSEQVVYDVSKDGQRFLINTYVKNTDTKPMTVVLHWGE